MKWILFISIVIGTKVANSQPLEFEVAKPIGTSVSIDKLSIYETSNFTVKATTLMKGDSVRIIGWRAWTVYLEIPGMGTRGYAAYQGVMWKQDSLYQLITTRSPELASRELQEGQKRVGLANKEMHSFLKRRMKRKRNGPIFVPSGQPFSVGTNMHFAK